MPFIDIWETEGVRLDAAKLNPERRCPLSNPRYVSREEWDEIHRLMREFERLQSMLADVRNRPVTDPDFLETLQDSWRTIIRDVLTSEAKIQKT